MNDVSQAYQDNAVRGASPVELVIVLFDAAIEDMRQAMADMQANRIESRSHHITHALMVLQQLQGTLDFERGGSAARQFEQFYNLVRAKLLESQMRGSHELMRQQVRAMSEVRTCWVEARRLLEPKTVVEPAILAAAAASEDGPTSEWKA